MLVVNQRRDFARGAARNQPIRAFGNLPVDELAK